MSGLRLVLMVALVLVLGLEARADEKGNKEGDIKDKLVGVWKPNKDNVKIEFVKGGKLKITGKKGDKTVTFEGTWKVVEKTKVKINFKIGDKEKNSTLEIVKLTSKELVTKDEDGKKDTFTRTK